MRWCWPNLLSFTCVRRCLFGYCDHVLTGDLRRRCPCNALAQHMVELTSGVVVPPALGWGGDAAGVAHRRCLLRRLLRRSGLASSRAPRKIVPCSGGPRFHLTPLTRRVLQVTRLPTTRLTPRPTKCPGLAVQWLGVVPRLVSKNLSSCATHYLRPSSALCPPPQAKFQGQWLGVMPRLVSKISQAAQHVMYVSVRAPTRP